MTPWPPAANPPVDCEQHVRDAIARSAGVSTASVIARAITGCERFPIIAERAARVTRGLACHEDLRSHTTDRERNWLIVDASGQTLGRLATQIADALRGKRKPTYTPHVDTGDFVVVVNAEKISVTGNKRADKRYYRHSGYPGGLSRARWTRCSSAGPRRSSASPSRACFRATGWRASS